MKTLAFTDIMDNYRRYGPRCSSHDLLKALAIAIMVTDHMGSFFFTDSLWLRAVGRMGTPIWFFLAGYARPSRSNAVLWQLGALVVLTDALTGESILPFNTLISVIACRYFVKTHVVTQELTPSNWFFAVFIITVLFPFSWILFEYDAVALAFALAGYYFRNRRGNPLATLTLILASVLFIIRQNQAFDFSLEHNVFLVVATALIVPMLYFLREGQIHNFGRFSWLEKPVNFMGRNSHYIYAVHLIIFQLLAHYVFFTRT